MNTNDRFPQPSEEVLQYLRAGEKLQAVKAYKEETGCSLIDAKNIIDGWTDEEAEPMASPDDELLELVRCGSKLQAVKLYKDKTGCDLKHAKDVIDDLYDQMRGTSDNQPSHDKGCSGCMSVLVVGLILAALLFYILL